MPDIDGSSDNDHDGSRSAAAEKGGRAIVEGPVSSLGWSRFFAVAALVVVFLALWQLILPRLGASLIERRADETMQRADASTVPFDRDMLSLKAMQLRQTAADMRRPAGLREALPMVAIVVGLLNLSRRLRAKSAREVLETDRRLPVVYFRSFIADTIDEVEAEVDRVAIGPTNFTTAEEKLVKALGRIGPVLAIGRPGERLGHVGAARLYTTHADWQRIASRLMASAQLIVIRAGLTAGICWELARARETLSPEKLLLWIPRQLPRVAYAQFIEMAREALKVELPPDLSRHQIVTFDAEWRPRAAAAEAAGDPFPARPRPLGVADEIERLPRLPASPRTESDPSASLRDLLEQLETRVASPPPFRLHAAAWVAVALWLVLLVVVPGPRWAFGLDLFLPEFARIPGIVAEGGCGMLLGLGLAFWFYLRDPARLAPASLALCGVLALDTALVIARVPPVALDTSRASTRLLCEKMVACASAEASAREDVVGRCIESQMRQASDGELRSVLAGINADVIAKCGTLECDAFGPCFIQVVRESAGKLGIPTDAPVLPADERRALIRLVCDAARENAGRVPDITAADASPKTKELRAAAERLPNPFLMADLVEEAMTSCTPGLSEGTEWETLNQDASDLNRAGKYDDALVVAKKAIEVAEKNVGLDHPDVATSLNILGGVYRAEGQYAQAEPLLKRALAIREKALGPAHPDVSTSLNNLAELYRTQGQYAQAEPLCKRSLAIAEEALGRDHPDVATSLNNLALLYEAQGQYAEAEPLVKRALAIFEKALGPDHPKVGTSLNNLALVYDIQGQHAQAEPLLKRSLAIAEKALGPDHPDVATILNNLALLYDTQGQYAKAELLYKRSLAIAEKALGPDHPDVAQSLENLAGLYRDMERTEDAEALEQRAARIRAIQR